MGASPETNASGPRDRLAELELKIPIFAFSHCRDVVAAVSKAGGLGVYGAALHSDSKIEVDLRWIEAQVEGRPYGVDLLMPSKYVGQESGGLDSRSLRDLVPEEHRAFVDALMVRYEVPERDRSERNPRDVVAGGTRYSAKDTESALECAFRFAPRLLVSALGTPPRHILEAAHERGMLVGALAGKVQHALAHQRAGVDLIIAQSYEAGGHTGDIGGIVLVPEIVEAVHPTPVLMAGGIVRGSQIAAALALGAQGVWCGSVWLTTAESDVLPLVKQKLFAASSSDTVRTRAWTGKHARFLRTPWSDEWDAPGNPKPLPTPLQSFAIDGALARIAKGAEARSASADKGAGLLMSSPVGQGVGYLRHEQTCRQVIEEMLQECVDTVGRISDVLDNV